MRALKIFPSRMFFFPTHLLHSPGRLQTFIQSWKQKYSDQALLSTHVHIWNSHIETLQSLTYTFLLPFNAMPALKDKKEHLLPNTATPHRKKNYFKPLILLPRNWPTKFPNIFERQKFFTQCRWLFSWFPAPTWVFFSPGVHGLVLSFFSLVLPRGSISNGSRIPLVGNGGSSSVHAFTFNLFHDKHNTRKFWNES